MWAGGLAAILVFATTSAVAQDVQVRSEAVIGSSDAVIVPDLFDDIENLAFGYWVPPAGGRDFKTIGFRPTGGLIVQDGTIFREYRADGSERVSDAFPFDCTQLSFQSPKGKGTQETFLNDCDASVILLDNTMRIYGNVKGQGLKGIAYDLSNPGSAYRVTKEPPPQITDAIADESTNAVEFRGGPRILVAGDRKSVFAIDITSDITVLDSEDTVTPVATFNGSKIDSFAVAGQYLVIAFQGGEIRRFDTLTGADEYLYQHPICEDPALGRKTPQRFAVRQDPDELVVFALNRACANLVVLDPTNLASPIVDTDGDFVDAFALTNVAMDGSTDTINPEAADARPGESGTFADCEEGETCQLGQIADQLTQSNSTVVEVQTYDPGYRMFQSYLTDCRWTGDVPCPIMNPGEPDPSKQILNLTELVIQSDSTGELERLVPNRDDPATIPGRFRGEAYFPNRTGDPADCKYPAMSDTEVCFNNYEFYSFFAVSDVVFGGVFELTVDVDQFRLNESGASISFDPCPVVLQPGADELTREDEVNDRANVVVHNRDKYDTIADDNGEFKSAVLIDRACGSRKAGGFDWSYTSTGLEPADFTARDYLDFADLQLTQIQHLKDEKLCSPVEDLNNPGNFFQVLSDTDCALVQSRLDQVRSKADVCFAALQNPQQGESRENCNALFSQLDNLVATLQLQITRPDPANPADIPKLESAFLAEFESRIDAFRFSTEEWLLNVTPDGGIPLAP